MNSLDLNGFNIQMWFRWKVDVNGKTNKELLKKNQIMFSHNLTCHL